MQLQQSAIYLLSHRFFRLILRRLVEAYNTYEHQIDMIHTDTRMCSMDAYLMYAWKSAGEAQGLFRSGF